MARQHAPQEHRPTAAPAVIALEHVVAGYDSRAALDDVSLSVGPGSMVAIFGPNGGGKSTLLKVIAGLLRPWSGTVTVLGQPAGRAARRIAYVPQAELVDWGFPVGVWDVAMMGRFPGLGIGRRPGAADRTAVEAALRLVGMLDLQRTQIGSLSGGQRRRAFLARAIAADPEIYLLDEPMTGVDAATQEDIAAVMATEAGRGKTLLATTHDLAAAAAHFERVVAINQTVVADGPSDLVLDADVLARTYGHRLLTIRGGTVLLDDAHHHDSAAPGEVHHHDERPER